MKDIGRTHAAKPSAHAETGGFAPSPQQCPQHRQGCLTGAGKTQVQSPGSTNESLHPRTFRFKHLFI